MNRSGFLVVCKRQNSYKSNLLPCSVEFCGKGFQFGVSTNQKTESAAVCKQPNRSGFSLFAKRQNCNKSNLPPCSIEFCGKGFQFGVSTNQKIGKNSPFFCISSKRIRKEKALAIFFQHFSQAPKRNLYSTNVIPIG